MAGSAKVVVVSQHYPPDPTTTAAIMAEIANHLAIRHAVLVLSGTLRLLLTLEEGLRRALAEPEP